jgi:hypothetical protein
MNQLATLPATVRQTGTIVANRAHVVPTLIDAAGDRASRRFLEFFAANIRNANSRRAYGHVMAEFLTWCDFRACQRSRPCNRHAAYPPRTRSAPRHASMPLLRTDQAVVGRAD